MSNTETNKNEKSYDYSSIRVKGKTKEEVNKFLDKVNKADDCGKITFDAFFYSLLRLKCPFCDKFIFKCTPVGYKYLKVLQFK